MKQLYYSVVNNKVMWHVLHWIFTTFYFVLRAKSVLLRFGYKSHFLRKYRKEWIRDCVWIYKTANFNAGAGEGYFVDTSSNTVTVTLPTGVIGESVTVLDYVSNANRIGGRVFSRLPFHSFHNKEFHERSSMFFMLKSYLK